MTESATIDSADVRSGTRGSLPSVGDKMRTLAEVGEISRKLRADGETVVLAHGVFDLLHVGHVRHLQEARSHGTKLIVTITPDRFVNKGPHRPVFTEPLRLEMLASLAYVDYVAINTGPTAEPAIEAIRPSVYIKGQDYAVDADDVTGKIVVERELVESFGGRIAFTDDITFSSTELINRHLNPHKPAIREFLDGMRDDGALDRVLHLIESVRSLRVLIVGDTILDEYRYVLPMSKTPKENLIATLHQSSELFAGGALATANHVAGLCDDVEILTVHGRADDRLDFVRENLRPNVRLHSSPGCAGPTTRKCRYIDRNSMRKLFEVYHMDDTPASSELEEELTGFIEERADDFDLILVNDFGHGMITRSLIRALTERARFLAVNTQTNSANFGFNLIDRYPCADYVCIDSAEARLAARDRHGSIESVIRDRLIPAVNCPRFIVTQASRGCVGFQKGEATSEVPAFADKIVDTVGAGDAFLAVTAPLLAAGGNMRDTAFIGNVAGALKVGIVGHRRSIDKASLIKSVISLLR